MRHAIPPTLLSLTSPPNMWSQVLRRPLAGARLHRTVLFARKYNGQPQKQQDLPHTTYFQRPPQPDRPPRRALRATIIAFGFLTIGIVLGVAISMRFEEREELEGEGPAIADMRALHAHFSSMPPGQMDAILSAALQNENATRVSSLDLKHAQMLLEFDKGRAISAKCVCDHSTLASNMPCEDVMMAGEYSYFSKRAKNWLFFAIFDGHAGPRTAHALHGLLPGNVGDRLYTSGCMGRGYVPNDKLVNHAIKSAFRSVDEDLLESAQEAVENPDAELSVKYAMTAPVMSGSCALLALFDPVNSVLRVANTGDSRAVLGRWDSAAGKYVARPMSCDQTGFNKDEIQRLRREHPGEDVVDPKTGRVHGIAVSRAFGDARWKWSNELTTYAHEKLFGPAPRPNGVIKTPPYLIAEPEITETQIQAGSKPDFLIMASDGLWDNMSSEDAVTCVQMWLDKYRPSIPLDKDRLGEMLGKPPFDLEGPGSVWQYDTTEDDETYYDPNERSMKWRVSPKHFVVEDDHAGTHLVKNALGGSRRNLFCGIMGVQPPLSRNVRDDITVQVLFFGDALDVEARSRAEQRQFDRHGKR